MLWAETPQMIIILSSDEVAFATLYRDSAFIGPCHGPMGDFSGSKIFREVGERTVQTDGFSSPGDERSSPRS